MDSIFLLLLLMALTLVIGSILGFVSFGRTNNLRERIDRLEAELDRLNAGAHRPGSAMVDSVTGPIEPQTGPSGADSATPAGNFDQTRQQDRRGLGISDNGDAEVDSVTTRSDAKINSFDQSGVAELAGPPETAATADEPVQEGSGDTTAHGDNATGDTSTGDTSTGDKATGESSAGDRPARSPRDLEAAIGTRWTVWVGGLALALGGIFLVRYSIEAGLIGPGLRILLGLVFALALLGGSEYLRRSGFAETGGDAGRRAYVPGVLAAAGTVAIFADVYAAYALYGFLPPLVAFAALAAVAMGTLLLALLHGPALAALGLAASYATPMLVSNDPQSLTGLAAYILVVTAATLALGRLRGWRWLAFVAIAGAFGWSLVMFVLSRDNGIDPWVIGAYLALAAGLAFQTFVASIHVRDRTAEVPQDWPALVATGLFALPAVIHVIWFEGGTPSVLLLTALTFAFALAAQEWPALRGLAFVGGGAAVLGFASFDNDVLPIYYNPITDPTNLPDFATFLASDGGRHFLGIGLLLLLGHAVIGLRGALLSRAKAAAGLTGGMVPLALLTVVYLLTTRLEASGILAAAALALAFYLMSTTEYLLRRLDDDVPGRDGALALYALAAVGSLAAAFAFIAEKGALTIALALMVPAIAWVESFRPVKGLRLGAALVAGFVALRIAIDPRIVGDDLGTGVLFNWLLYGYGVPALAFALAARRFARTADDRVYVPLFEALAVIFTTLTAVMEIHHGMNGGEMFRPVSGLAEQSLLTMSLLAVSFGLHWIAIRRQTPVFSTGTLVTGAIGLVGAGIGLIVVQNPAVTGETVTGGPLSGQLIVGYLLPGIMALVAARLAARRTDRPVWYIRLAATLGGLLLALWLTYAVRAGWHDADFAWGPPAEAELYAYSAVWLAAGLILLGIGAALRLRSLRLIAAALVLGVVAKVFLIDTSGLTGGLRALSFIGLGAVLVAVGLAYQKLMRGRS